MIISIFKFDFYQAFRFNPLLFIMFPFLIFYETLYYINWLHDREFKISKKIWYIVLVITILFGLLRNLEGFSYLAPTIIKK